MRPTSSLTGRRLTNRILHVGQPAGSAAPASRADAEFARADRHSRKVRILKFGLPIAAGAMVLIGIGVAWVARTLPGDLSFASTSIENGRLVMQDPRLTGNDSSDRPYAMVARRAIQSSMGGGGVDLEEIRADVAVDAQTNATITAGNGFYDVASEQLKLFDDIVVSTTNGIQIRLAAADIDLGAGRMLGHGAITITTPSQRLESGSVSIAEGGQVLSFGERVKLTLLPTATDQPPSE